MWGSCVKVKWARGMLWQVVGVQRGQGHEWSVSAPREHHWMGGKAENNDCTSTKFPTDVCLKDIEIK